MTTGIARATSLLVVDVQHGAVARGPHRAGEVLENIRTLIGACRRSGIAVIYAQHDEPPGTEGEPGSEAWKIHESVEPEPGELVFRKRHNSAFLETGLGQHLEKREVTTLIVVGIQTEYCVDTTVRVAFENGFRVVVPEMTNTTYDNGDVTAEQIYDLYNRRIFDRRFASVLSMAATLEAIDNGGRWP